MLYSRRAVEQLVGPLYDVMGSPAPYGNDLATRIAARRSRRRSASRSSRSSNLIRRVGNIAAHEGKPVESQTALKVLRELFHVMVFAAFRYAADPQGVPTSKQFDPTLAAKPAPLSRSELVRLAAKFRAQHKSHAKAPSERDELAGAKDAEIAALKARIAAA